MLRTALCLAVLAAALSFAAPADAQVVTYYSPVVAPAPPVVVHRAYYAPPVARTSYYAPRTAYYAPAPAPVVVSRGVAPVTYTRTRYRPFFGTAVTRTYTRYAPTTYVYPAW